MRAVLLLDRDGTLMDDVGYPRDPAAVRLVPGAADAVRRLVARGYAAIIVSNQSGLARGLITPAELDAVQERFADLFEASSGVLLPWLYCPHGPADGCDCRKPLPGLLNQAASAVNPRLPRVMVGDKPADVAAGIAAGARTAWLAHGRPYPPGEPVPNLIADDWGTIADWAERLLGGSDG